MSDKTENQELATVRVTYKNGDVKDYKIRKIELTSVIKYGIVLAAGILIGKKFC